MMNRKIAKALKMLLPLLPPAFIVAYVVLFSPSCANTTTPPSGGPKDTIPPVIRKMEPMSGAVNVPRHKTRLEFTFDEYVVVKDPKSLFLSPPLSKAPKYKISGKSVIISFEEDLDSAKTYVLDQRHRRQQ